MTKKWGKLRNGLSVIIVNWNTRDMLQNCLESLREDMAGQGIKVIVVDNDSKDGSRDMVQTKFPSVTLINSGGNIGFGRANNFAIPVTDTRYVVFLNPDTLVMKGTLSTMVNFMERNTDIGGMSCKITYGPNQNETTGTEDGAHTLGLQWFPSPLTELIQLLFLTDKTILKFKKILPYKNPNESHYVKKLYGTCLMVRKSILEQIGYFDEQFFMYGEDVDISKRITDAGWKLYYLSDVSIAHLAGGSTSNTNSEFSTLMKCESISKLIKKNYGKLGQRIYKIVILTGALLRFCALKIGRIIHRSRPISINSAQEKKYVAMIKWSLGMTRPSIPG